MPFYGHDTPLHTLRWLLLARVLVGFEGRCSKTGRKRDKAATHIHAYTPYIIALDTLDPNGQPAVAGVERRETAEIKRQTDRQVALRRCGWAGSRVRLALE